MIEHFKLSVRDDAENRRRVDFFCISTRGRYLVVEIKRPDEPIGKDEVTQIMDYVGYLREQAPTSGQSRAPNHFEGVLVGHHVTEAGKRWREKAAKDAITVRPWGELLDVAERIHRDFLDTMKKRVPEDVRVQNLAQLDDDAEETHA